MDNNIFKGVSPYTEEDSKWFKGRDVEAKALKYLVIHNDFSVCYADSGEGKTSLINAGLVPMLRRENMLPVRINFNDDDFYTENPSVDYFDKMVFAKILATIAQVRSTDSSKAEFWQQQFEKYPNLEWTNLNTDKSLGECLRSGVITNGEEKFFLVFIFDQFEEVFTRPKNNHWTNIFFKWLEQLYNDCKPKEFGDTDANKFKVLVSLRSDFLCELDYWSMTKYFIPSFKNNRYCLKPLTKDGAFEVVKKLPKELLNGFEYDDIIEFAKIEKAGDIDQEGYDLPCVSALMLSIILSSLERGLSKKIAQGISLGIDSNKKVVLNTILEEYYESSMLHCNISKNEKGYIESALIDSKGQRRRVSLHKEELEGISKNKLLKLANRRIVNIINDEFEISHDCLKPIIDKHNKERLLKTENKFFYTWESGIFAFICIGCFFLIENMFGTATDVCQEGGSKIGFWNIISKNWNISINLLFLLSLLPLPFIAFLKFQKALENKTKVFTYALPLFVLVTGYLSIFHFVDFNILAGIFKISVGLIKISCYIYILILTILVALIYLQKFKVFPTKTASDKVENHLRYWYNLTGRNILWAIFFASLAVLLQVHPRIVGGQWGVICILLYFSYICITNIFVKNKTVRNICQLTFCVLVFGTGFFFYQSSLHISLELFYLFILVVPLAIGFFDKNTVLRKLKVVFAFLFVNLFFFYILTLFINPVLFVKGYNITSIGSEGFIMVEKNGKESIYTRNGIQVFDIEFNKGYISKYRASLKNPVSVYKIPIRNTQKNLFEDAIFMLPFSVSATNDSINIYRHPDLYGRYYILLKDGTQEEKLVDSLCVDLIKFMVCNTNEPLCEERIPKISKLYISLEDSLKKNSCVTDYNDIVKLQQIMTNYVYVGMLRDAIRDNRKADAIKLLTLLSYSCLGNTPVYNGLTINCTISLNDSFNSKKKEWLLSSIKTIGSVSLNHEMMRNQQNTVVDTFWYNNFIGSLMIASKFLTEYNVAAVPDVSKIGASTVTSTGISKKKMEYYIASVYENVETLKNRIENFTNNDKSYLVKALINCTNQIAVLLRYDTNQERHDWRSFLEYRFLVNLYNVLPTHSLISKSKDEILSQDMQLKENFKIEAENVVNDILQKLQEYRDCLEKQEKQYILYQKLHKEYTSKVKR